MSVATMPISARVLAESRAYCRELTRRQAKNFYYGLRLLAEPKRSAMYALYAYMRQADDIADDDTQSRSVAQRQADLEAFQTQTHAVLNGTAVPPEGVGAETARLWPAFAALVGQYRIPAKFFDDMIAGQRQDLTPVDLQDFAELHEYCYRVASVVGLASIYVWGFEGGAATEQLAIDRGIAFQLTNVLRDVREDALKGRCYLPREDLAKYGVTVEQIRGGEVRAGFLDLMRFEVGRADGYYERSGVLEGRIERDSRPTLAAMTEIYRSLLRKVGQEPERVLRERVSLSLAAKLMIGWRALRSRA